jgi:cytochrome c peroxidase
MSGFARALRAGVGLALLMTGCDGSTSDGAAPAIIPEQAWAELQKLSPSATALPLPPVDASNHVADDPVAASFGQKLFFDPGFSGALLESDNDGTHGGVGRQGETGKVSCASCHLPASGFTDTRTVHKQLSLASGWTFRRTPSLLDVGHARLLMWDGRFDSLQRQVISVFESPLEGNSSRLFLAQEIARRYAAQYQAVFGTDPQVVLAGTYPQPTAATTGCQITLSGTTTPNEQCTNGTLHGMPGATDYDALSDSQKREVTTIALNAGKAVAAYERLLSCGTSRFDAFMHGDKNALTEAEQRGAALFVGKAKCANCHSGPFLSDQKFHNVGLFPRLVSSVFLRNNDQGAFKGFAQVRADTLNTESMFSDGTDGRLPASPGPELMGAFRTPMLRCASQRPSFMHDGQFRSLERVVEFFNNGGDKQPGVAADPIFGYLGETEIAPLGLGSQEQSDLVAFLKALDGPGPAPQLLQAPGP